MRSVRIARLPLSLCLRPPRVRPTYRPVSMSAAGEKRPRLEGEAADASASGKQVIATERAPRAIGPYSQAIKANGQVFVSGMIGFNLETMKLVSEDPVEQARQALQHLQNVLEAAGSSLDKVVHCTVLMTDINDYKAVNEVYAQFFTAQPPARAAYQVSALPAGAKVEITCIALA